MIHKKVKDFLTEEEKQRFEEANTLMRVAKDIKTFEKYKLEVIELLETAAERAVSYYSGSKEKSIVSDESYNK